MYKKDDKAPPLQQGDSKQKGFQTKKQQVGHTEGARDGPYLSFTANAVHWNIISGSSKPSPHPTHGFYFNLLF